jgi:hypothetical protein
MSRGRQWCGSGASPNRPLDERHRTPCPAKMRNLEDGGQGPAQNDMEENEGGRRPCPWQQHEWRQHEQHQVQGFANQQFRTLLSGQRDGVPLIQSAASEAAELFPQQRLHGVQPIVEKRFQLLGAKAGFPGANRRESQHAARLEIVVPAGHVRLAVVQRLMLVDPEVSGRPEHHRAKPCRTTVRLRPATHASSSVNSPRVHTPSLMRNSLGGRRFSTAGSCLKGLAGGVSDIRTGWTADSSASELDRFIEASFVIRTPRAYVRVATSRNQTVFGALRLLFLLSPLLASGGPTGGPPQKEQSNDHRNRKILQRRQGLRLHST